MKSWKLFFFQKPYFINFLKKIPLISFTNFTVDITCPGLSAI